MKNTFGRIIHLVFITISGYFVSQLEWDKALIYLGLGLAFDPFEPQQAWQDKPLWQRAVLITELMACLILGISLFWPEFKIQLHHFLS